MWVSMRERVCVYVCVCVCVLWFHVPDPILSNWMWLLHHTAQFAEPVARHIGSNDIVTEGGGDGGVCGWLYCS